MCRTPWCVRHNVKRRRAARNLLMVINVQDPESSGFRYVAARQCKHWKNGNTTWFEIIVSWWCRHEEFENNWNFARTQQRLIHLGEPEHFSDAVKPWYLVFDPDQFTLNMNGYKVYGLIFLTVTMILFTRIMLITFLWNSTANRNIW